MADELISKLLADWTLNCTTWRVFLVSEKVCLIKGTIMSVSCLSCARSLLTRQLDGSVVLQNGRHLRPPSLWWGWWHLRIIMLTDGALYGCLLWLSSLPYMYIHVEIHVEKLCRSSTSGPTLYGILNLHICGQHQGILPPGCPQPEERWWAYQCLWGVSRHILSSWQRESVAAFSAPS